MTCVKVMKLPHKASNSNMDNVFTGIQETTSS